MENKAEETQRPVRSSPAAMQILLLASGELRGGLDAPVQSQHILASFLKHDKPNAERLCEALGIQKEMLQQELKRELPAEAVPEATEKMKELLGEDRKQVMPQVIRDATRQARQWATAVRNHSCPLPMVIASLLSLDCNARTVTLDLSSTENLEEGILLLKTLPDSVIDKDYFVKENMRNIFARTDSLWPSMQEDLAREHPQLADVDKKRDELYEKNPEKYDSYVPLIERLNKVATIEDRPFLLRSGVCLSAAEYQARIRKAPEIEPEHVLLVLIEDGTASSRFLDEHGVDRTAMKKRLEELLPTYDSGPRWPPHSSRLSMSMPGDGTRKVEGLKIDLDTKIEPSEIKIVEMPERRFSDVLWLESLMTRFDTPAAQLLSEAGVTKAAVREFYENGG